VRKLGAKTEAIIRVLERKRKGAMCGFKNFPRKRVFCGCVGVHFIMDSMPPAIAARNDTIK
jgi:hypothetical protein